MSLSKFSGLPTGRWLDVLRRMRDLGGGWQYADHISVHGDGRTVGAVLDALHRSGFVERSYCRRPIGSSTTWILTSAGREAAK